MVGYDKNQLVVNTSKSNIMVVSSRPRYVITNDNNNDVLLSDEILINSS